MNFFNKKHIKLVKEHFEMKYYDYDDLIKKLIPKYKEMHQKTVDLIDFPRDKELNILDLGVGTGQTALKLLNKYPKAKIDGFDISPRMIEQGKIRLKEYLNRITFIEKNIAQLNLSKKYNACIAVLSIHHLNEKQKSELFKQIYNHLSEQGILAIGDIIKFNSKQETKEKEKEWKQFLIDNLGKEEGNYWFENYQEEDLPSSVSDQLKWLKEAEFKEVGCVWQYMNYAVLFARK